MGVERTSLRRTTAKVLFVGLLLVHAALVVRVGNDPHKLFGFRPFNESDSWRAEIVRVTTDGTRVPIDDGSWEYDWDDLVDNSNVGRPGALRHANGGASATLDLLARALDWVAVHTPLDRDTAWLEARVTVYRNGRGPEHHRLRSVDRTEPGERAP